MQSRADREGKCFTMEGGFDIFLFGVVVGKGMLVEVFGFKRNLVEISYQLLWEITMINIV